MNNSVEDLYGQMGCLRVAPFDNTHFFRLYVKASAR